MHSYADRGQKTFLISTLVDIEIQYNYKSQKTFLISTLVDSKFVTNRDKVKRPF